MPTPKPRNGVGGWIAIAMLCGGASGGATWFRPAPAHNPEITTTGWNKVILDMELMKRDLAALALASDANARLITDVHEIVLRLPQTPP